MFQSLNTLSYSVMTNAYFDFTPRETKAKRACVISPSYLGASCLGVRDKFQSQMLKSALLHFIFKLIF